MISPYSRILRGDIWLVSFDPTVGDEIQKTRPAVVISIGAAFRYRLRIVVPITGWQEKFSGEFWMVRLAVSPTNGLGKVSAANALQVKSLSEQRFVHRIGLLESDDLNRIAAAVALCIGYSPT